MDMRELVEDYLGPPARKTSQWYWWHCPLHADASPSLGVQEDHAHCFSAGCRFHGGPLRFLVDMMGLSLEQARRSIGGSGGAYAPAHPRRESVRVRLPPSPPPRSWREEVEPLIMQAQAQLDLGRRELEGRGIRLETAARFRLGYWRGRWHRFSGGGWLATGLVLPVYIRGELWSVNVRTRGGDRKYLRVLGGSPRALFGVAQAQGCATLIIAEGEFDAVLAAQETEGQADVIALRGAGVLLDDWSDFILPYERVVLALDGDEAGQLRAAELLEQHPFWENRCPPDGLDLCKMHQAGYSVRDFLLGGRCHEVL